MIKVIIMVNYNEGKIYKLLNTENDEVYIGSTTLPLHKRLYYHRKNSRLGHSSRVYNHMRELGVDKFYIELIEDFPCTNNSMLEAREGVFIREIGTLNMRIEGRSRQEWAQDNAQRIKEQRAKHHIENKQRLNEISAKYQKDHKEEISKQRAEFRRKNKDKLKEANAKYRAENAQKIKEQKAKYQIENKQRLNEISAKYYKEHKEELNKKHRAYASVKIMCECGCEIRRDSLTKHKKTQKHKHLMEELEKITLEDKETNIKEQE